MSLQGRRADGRPPRRLSPRGGGNLATAMATSKARALAFWKKYRFFITMGIILLAGFLLYNLPRASQRTVSDALSPTIGGSEAGLLLGYYSAILLLLAQFYTVVKRSWYIPLSQKLGGAGRSLNIHIVMSIVALVAY